MDKYKLSAVLEGHKLDVRCICSLPSGHEFGSAIVSGSRDDTARLWNATTESNWNPLTVYKGHPRYVSSVAYREPDEKFSQGLIYTGCLDGLIRAFEPQNPDTHHTLEGHTGAVASIFVSANKTLLTGSWDKTARVWLNEKSVTTLKGHEGAVWCAVILPNVGIMVTGSADYSLRLWKGGQCKRKITGVHTQAVRDLGVVSSNRIVSCSNDGQIILWEVEEVAGEEGIKANVLSKFEDSDYVYSLSVYSILENMNGWVSSGENTGIKVFEKDGKLSQTLSVPAQSVWCVTVLHNGDIAAGCSDHRIYVFSKDSERIAPADRIVLYEAELEEFTKSLNDVTNGTGGSGLPEEVGGVKVCDMPIGPEALANPGRRDGQTKMVKWPKENKITAHSWSEAEQKWTLLGDVVGNDDNVQTGKSMFDGKEYDYVFNIDIGDGIPALKLPYNRDQDPYTVAQAFIHSSELPQAYLDEIAGFIIKNSNHVPPSQGVAVDPFTGSGAYISGSGGVEASSFTGGVADPFTGSGAYSSQPMDIDDDQDASEYFPQKSYLQFTQVPNVEALEKKLKQLNESIPKEVQITEAEATRVVSLFKEESMLLTDIPLLFKVLRWPRNAENPPFNPVLDVVRLAFVDQSKTVLSQALLQSSEIGNEFADIMIGFITDKNKPINQMLAVKAVANIFPCDKGIELMCRLKGTILEHAGNLIPSDNKNCQVAVATLILNYAIASTTSKVDTELQKQCITLTSLLIMGLTDPEAKYRTLIALGSLINASSANVRYAKEMEMKASVKSAMMLVEQGHKIHKVAKLINNRL